MEEERGTANRLSSFTNIWGVGIQQIQDTSEQASQQATAPQAATPKEAPQATPQEATPQEATHATPQNDDYAEGDIQVDRVEDIDYEYDGGQDDDFEEVDIQDDRMEDEY